MALYLAFELIRYSPDPEILELSEALANFLRASYATTTVLTMFLFFLLVEVTAERNELKLENISLTDQLTDLSNRRLFEIAFRQEVARGRRDHKPLALAMLDLDHFKQVNDAYGHQVGDEVLQHIARHLRNATREGNVVARVGGEEFAVLFPGLALPEAVEVTERIRKVIEVNGFRLKQQTLNITISAGVAMVDYEKPLEHSYELADEALYQAKREGRNRVVACGTA